VVIDKAAFDLLTGGASIYSQEARGNRSYKSEVSIICIRKSFRSDAQCHYVWILNGRFLSAKWLCSYKIRRNLEFPYF
jgi:hypothetical protein